MKIFITGSDGFIGSHMVKTLTSQGHSLTPLTCDLRDHAGVEQQLRDASPDLIVHLAARTEVEKSFYEQTTFSDINYTGTVNLIESAARLSHKPHFVFASTMEVYGWQPESDLIRDGKPFTLPVFDEHTVPHPNAPYAVAKYGCEKYLEYASRSLGITYTIIRQTNAYGRKDNTFFVTERIISQMLGDAHTCKLGYATPYRNFIYIDDLLSAWETVINNPDKCRNQLYTLGPANAIQIKEYAEWIASLLDWDGTIEWNTQPHRPGEIYVLNSNHNLLTEHTGWMPKVTLEQGLMLTIDHWKSQIVRYHPC
jgi:UDP-glucose 4-epimerase